DFEGHSGPYGQPGDAGSGNKKSGGGRKRPGGRIAVAAALAVVFVAFCAGISYLAVNSVQSQLAIAQQEERTQEEQNGTDAGTQDSEAQPAEGGIESAGTIRESGDVTAVVTDVTDVVEKVMPACVSITNNF